MTRTASLALSASVLLLAGAAVAAPVNAPRPTDLTSADYTLEATTDAGAVLSTPIRPVNWRALSGLRGCSGVLGAGEMTFKALSGDPPPVGIIKTAVLFVRKAPTKSSGYTVKFEKIVISSATPTSAQNSSAVVSLGKLGRMQYSGGSWSIEGCRS
jgi:hypothetical protein